MTLGLGGVGGTLFAGHSLLYTSLILLHLIGHDFDSEEDAGQIVTPFSNYRDFLILSPIPPKQK